MERRSGPHRYIEMRAYPPKIATWHTRHKERPRPVRPRARSAGDRSKILVSRGFAKLFTGPEVTHVASYQHPGGEVFSRCDFDQERGPESCALCDDSF